MKRLEWFLIGARLMVLAGGLALLGAGCDGGAGSATSSPEQVKQWVEADQDRAKAMENASQQAKAQKKAH